ncbi:MAG: M16 family metallopeptidase, partial [Acidobacteriota bacterium]
MKHPSALPFLIMTGALMSAGEARAAGGFSLPPWQTRVLGNGLRIQVMEFHELPLVTFRVVVAVGSAQDPAGKAGLADMVADLLRKGTTSRSAMEIADTVDFAGGSLDTEAERDATHLEAEFLAKDLATGLDLLADVLLHPAFAAGEVDRLRGEKIAALKGIRENPGALATRRFAELLYKDHPYGHPVTGWEASVSSITREDVLAFHKRHYVPSSVVVTAVGDVDAADLFSQLERRFAGWRGPDGPHEPLPAPSGPKRRAIYLIDKPDATQSQIRIGGLGIARKDPDYVPLLVANTILGGGFTSRLVEEIRVNRGLSYGARSGFYPHVQTGPFMIRTFTKTATTRETVQVALDCLERFCREGATEEELEKARRFLTGTFAIGHQSPGSMAGALSEIAFYRLPADYFDSYLERVRAVTLDDVKRVASTRFPSDKLAIVVLGNASAVRADLEKIGSVKPAPI